MLKNPVFPVLDGLPDNKEEITKCLKCLTAIVCRLTSKGLLPEWKESWEMLSSGITYNGRDLSSPDSCQDPEAFSGQDLGRFQEKLEKAINTLQQLEAYDKIISFINKSVQPANRASQPHPQSHNSPGSYEEKRHQDLAKHSVDFRSKLQRNCMKKALMDSGVEFFEGEIIESQYRPGSNLLNPLGGFIDWISVLERFKLAVAANTPEAIKLRIDGVLNKEAA